MRLQLLVLLSSLLVPLNSVYADTQNDAASSDAASSDAASSDAAAPGSNAEAPSGDAPAGVAGEAPAAAGGAEAPAGDLNAAGDPAGDAVGTEGAPEGSPDAAAATDSAAESANTEIAPAVDHSTSHGDDSGGTELDFSMGEALKHFTGLTWAVFFVLVGMSVGSLAVAINRAIYFFRARKQSVLFATAVSEGLGKGDVDGVLEEADAPEAAFSYLARIVRTGLTDARDVKEKLGGLEKLETVDHAMERTIIEEGVALRKWLTILATSASTAPFVGLLGTVFGIINSFKGMAQSESAGISAVAGGIAEALYMTGLGLVVAIPAVWLYNWANARIEGFEAEMANAASEMLDWVKKNKSSI
jgi:biopolymer transport protein ExbB/TolQ